MCKEIQTEHSDKPRHTHTDWQGGSNTRPYPAHNIYSVNFAHFNSRVMSVGRKHVRAGSERGMGTLSWMERMARSAHEVNSWCKTRQGGTSLGIMSFHRNTSKKLGEAVKKWIKNGMDFLKLLSWYLGS